ncbi:uncharacterized protein LOC121055198 [Oryza brachyantha]|uniref:uncharacterized protein LOC121055198 n=1 Tax=Oryza brachyantha TaxID=4533 RepID=UPI0003EA8114|nr:uncharacterized protein LOC121055198 [Oryza brachyantha]
MDHYYSKGHSNSMPKQQGTANYGTSSYKDSNSQSTTSSFYNGSSKGTSTGRMPAQQNSEQYYVNSVSRPSHGQQGGGVPRNTSKGMTINKYPSLKG